MFTLSSPDGLLYDKMMFNKPIFSVRHGDINRDGSDEILIGIIKRTKFDFTEKPRLLIFRVDSLKFRPFFFASRLRGQILDFGVHAHISKTIVVLEKEPDSIYAVNLYKTMRFGLRYLRTVKQNHTLSLVNKEFTHAIIK